MFPLPFKSIFTYMCYTCYKYLLTNVHPWSPVTHGSCHAWKKPSWEEPSWEKLPWRVACVAKCH